MPGRVATLEVETADGPAALARLLAGDPPVHVGERNVAHGVLTVDLQAVRAEDDAFLAAALAKATD